MNDPARPTSPRPRHRAAPVVTRAARLLATGLLVVGLAACSDGRPSTDDGLRALEVAIADLGPARRAVLAAQGAVVDGFTAVDAVDEAAVAGEHDAASERRAAADGPEKQSRAALAALPDLLGTYDRALEALRSADVASGPALDTVQHGRMAAVLRTGAAEVDAMDDLRVAGNGAWATYGRLRAAYEVWVERAENGWYRTRQEAADAYAVATDGVRPALVDAREALQRADGTRLTAGTQVAIAVREADAALDSLRSPAVRPTGSPS